MIQPAFEPDSIELLNARAFLQKTFPEPFDEASGVLTYYMIEGYLFAACCSPTLVSPTSWMKTIWNGKIPNEDMEALALSTSHLMTLYNFINGCIRNDKAFMAKSASFLQPIEANLEDGTPIAQWTHGFILGDMPNLEFWEQLEEREEWDDDLDVVGYAGANLSIFLNRATAEDSFNQTEGEFKDFEDCLTYFKKNFDLSMHNYSVAGQNIYLDLLDQDESE